MDPPNLWIYVRPDPVDPVRCLHLTSCTLRSLLSLELGHSFVLKRGKGHTLGSGLRPEYGLF